MQLVLRYSGREGKRFILSLPYWVGMLQGMLLEKLPENLFTVTRDQVRPSPFNRSCTSTHLILSSGVITCMSHYAHHHNRPTNPFSSRLAELTTQVQQLKHDNIVAPIPPLNSVPFDRVLSAFPPSLPSSTPVVEGDPGLSSVYKVLPTYLGPQITRVEGKRTHGRPGVGFEEIERLREKRK